MRVNERKGAMFQLNNLPKKEDKSTIEYPPNIPSTSIRVLVLKRNPTTSPSIIEDRRNPDNEPEPETRDRATLVSRSWSASRARAALRPEKRKVRGWHRGKGGGEGVAGSWGKEARVSGATGGALSHTRKNSPLQLRQRPSASTDQFPHHQHRTQRKRQVRLGLQKLLKDTAAPSTHAPASIVSAEFTIRFYGPIRGGTS
ncbi:hypothetical protein KM043_002147 [Ampulex compressa]|nr:hypothetical protein KM043_002147 [Ampulex compressa]